MKLTGDSNSTAPHDTASAGPEHKPQTKKKTSAGVIAGAVVGAVAGVALLASLAAALFIRRKRKLSQAHRSRPLSIESQFEPTTDVQVIVPFTTTDGPSPNASGVVAYTQLPSEDSASTPGLSGTAEKNPAALHVGQSTGSAPTELAGAMSGSTLAVGSPQRAEDMEDARAGDLLPPEYKEAWGQRQSAVGEDQDSVSRSSGKGEQRAEGDRLL